MKIRITRPRGRKVCKKYIKQGLFYQKVFALIYYFQYLHFNTCWNENVNKFFVMNLYFSKHYAVITTFLFRRNNFFFLISASSRASSLLNIRKNELGPLLEEEKRSGMPIGNLKNHAFFQIVKLIFL